MRETRLSSLAAGHGLHRSSRLSKTLLADDSHSTDQEDQSLETKNDSQSDHGANDAVDNRAQSITALALGGNIVASRAGTGSRSVSSTSASGVAASGAPRLGVTNAELVHAGDKVVPGDKLITSTEERVSGRRAAGVGSTVVEQETDGDVVGSRERRGRSVGDQLESHGRSVIGDTVEVRVSDGQVCKTEERSKGAVGAELNTELALALSFDGVVQELNDFCGKNLASNGACVVRCVEGKVPFVSVGQSADLEKDIAGEDIG